MGLRYLMKTTTVDKPHAPPESLVENTARIHREALNGNGYRFFEMERSRVKSVAIQNQPAQYRIELADNLLYPPT